MILIDIRTAVSLRKTAANIVTPCSVKTNGFLRSPIRTVDSRSFAVCGTEAPSAGLDITDCDFQFANSSGDIWNMNRSGKAYSAFPSG